MNPQILRADEYIFTLTSLLAVAFPLTALFPSGTRVTSLQSRLLGSLPNFPTEKRLLSPLQVFTQPGLTERATHSVKFVN